MLPKNRVGFNSAMITSEEQQLLLNIVRTIFDDRPSFISVESITTSNSVSVGGGPGISYSPNVSYGSSVNGLDAAGGFIADASKSTSQSFGIGYSLSFNPNVNYSDSPTVSFAPLQGEKFTRQMLSPLTIPTLLLLLKSGWGAGKIFRITTDWLDGYFNESIMHTRVIPNNKPFVDLVNELRQLHEDNIIFFEAGEITEVTVD